MKKIFITFLSFFILFCGQTLAQTKEPIGVIRCSYEEKLKDYDNRKKLVIPENLYPWGVCFKKSGFLLKEGRHTLGTENEWIEVAMRRWNKGYENYKIRRWGDTDVLGIPDGPLFVESCNPNKHNIVYVAVSNLEKHLLGTHDFFMNNADYSFLRWISPLLWLNPLSWLVKLDWSTFGGLIKMNKRSTIKNRELFINVMMHELGHAIGLPHLPPEDTNIMQSINYGCDERFFICQHTDADFESFLWPYNPEEAITRKKSNRGGGIRICPGGIGPEGQCYHMP